MTEPKPTYQYTPPPAIQRETIIQLNQIVKRALYENAAMDDAILNRLLVGIERKTSEVLQKENK